MRTCAKAGCPDPPTATAALRYRERILWIGSLIPTRDPNLFDLCRRHADGLTAPYRWRRLDERHPPLPAATGA